jgi:hypothetical protein
MIYPIDQQNELYNFQRKKRQQKSDGMCREGIVLIPSRNNDAVCP